MWMTRFVIRAQYEKGVKWKKLQRLVRNWQLFDTV